MVIDDGNINHERNSDRHHVKKTSCDNKTNHNNKRDDGAHLIELKRDIQGALRNCVGFGVLGFGGWGLGFIM
jgi:hypothetical protein